MRDERERGEDDGEYGNEEREKGSKGEGEVDEGREKKRSAASSLHQRLLDPGPGYGLQLSIHVVVSSFKQQLTQLT